MQGREWQVLVISIFCAPATLADPSCLLRPDAAMQGSVQPPAASVEGSELSG